MEGGKEEGMGEREKKKKKDSEEIPFVPLKQNI